MQHVDTRNVGVPPADTVARALARAITCTLIIALMTLLASSSWAQRHNNVTISGSVKDSLTGETLPGAHIALLGTNHGAATNNYGFFSLRVPRGCDTILVSYVGYSPVRLALCLTQDTTVAVQLPPSLEIEQVTIEGQADHNSSRSARMGSIQVPKQVIQRVPMLLGERDALRIIQLLPGVQKGTEGTSGFYVRGGGPDQNLIVLDEAPVYNAYHMLGMFSLFNGSAIKNMELLKGGFPARYGGRLASVLEIVMEDGNMREWHGEAGLGLISSHAMVQGPIVKDKASFIVTGRRTYLDLLLRPFLSTEQGKPVFYFFDLTAKINWQITPRDRLYLSGYFGRDAFGMEYSEGSDGRSEVGIRWGNATGTLRWNRIINHSLFSNLTLIYSSYNFRVFANLFAGNDSFRTRYTTDIQNVGLKWDLDWRPIDGHTFRMGVSSIGYRFIPQSYLEQSTFSATVRNSINTVYSLEGALYAEDEMRLWDWGRANVGVRATSYAAKRFTKFSLEPRASLSVYLTRYLSAKGAFSLMGQNLHLLSSFGVNLPTDIWVPATRQLPPQSSWIASAGLSHDLPWIESTFSIEAYYKRTRGNIAYVSGATYAALSTPLGGNYWENLVTRGRSWSTGVEFLLQRKFGKLSGWLGYTLSWTRLQFDELNAGREFWARHDRRHDVSIVAMYQLSNRWRASATWVYGTGNAITLPAAIYEHKSYLHNIFGERIEEYGGLNSSRMADYHRLDLGIQYVRTNGRLEHTISIDVYNAYYQRNPFYYRVVSKTRLNPLTQQYEQRLELRQVTLFPVIPSISYKLKF